MSDGPYGLRKTIDSQNGKELETYRAICFPTLSCVANSWNSELLFKFGQAMAAEFDLRGSDVILGPGVNIKRCPLNGRNFEYFSEDPILTATLAKNFIRGAQGCGVGTALKHFACNNQEFDRHFSNSIVDERTLREIYLRAFEIIVKEAQPWMVMSAYNKVNGVSCFENKFLLDEILRKEWGYTGVVVSDWDSVKNRIKSLEATLDLEMPYRYEGLKEVQKVSSEESLQASVDRIKNLIIKKNSQKSLRKKAMLNQADRIKLCQEMAEESIVLLKNDHILPLEQGQSVLVIGEAAENPFIQGGGSARVNPIFVDSIYHEIKKQCPNTEFCQGYVVHNEGFGGIEAHNLADLTKKLETVNTGIIFVGNTYGTESENFDRDSLKLSKVMEELILTCTKVNKNVVVVLQSGSTLDISKWESEVKGIIHMGYAGIKGGTAIANILLGKISPSGRLAESYYTNLNDVPSINNFGVGPDVEYAEKLMVGYRGYTTLGSDVLYPFGYGLTYTEFEYVDYSIKKSNKNLEINVVVKNIGSHDAKETVQVYARPIVSDDEWQRPIRELKGFCKKNILSKNKQTFTINIPLEYFKYFSLTNNRWQLSDMYEIEIGPNVRTIKFKELIKGVYTNET
ncbi:MAG: glycoside hydrolase family 3 C-terminal domain-containing protein [Lactobacillaceae bacterium]|jgi:beta-glucosidase|nr:glycoside hydrolase family 3 C-terminal domain-containing protein [Lactobacillaceae bacterium]